MKTPPLDIFFVGFLNDIPRGLKVFLPVTAVVLLCLFAAVGYVAGATQDDPGPGAFTGRVQDVRGVVQARPYPTLTVTEDHKRYKRGQVLMLSGQGKRGATMRAEDLDGRQVTVNGAGLKRGTLDMIQLAGGKRGLSMAEPGEVAPDQPLGRWRVTGEICDGKCLAGAMRPGNGLAHKACANLCLIGEIPPVFAATAPLDGKLPGSDFLLLAGPDGGPMPAEMLGHVAALITVEGEVWRRGDLLIFRADPATVEIP